MNHRRPAATAVTLAALAALGVAGCAGGSGSSDSTPTGAVTGTSTSPTPAVQASDSASPATSAPASADGGGTAQVVAACSLIDQNTADQLLGGTVAAGKAAADAGKEQGGITKLDGCLYKGRTGSLGYDVVKFKGGSAEQFFAAAKARVKAELKKSGAAAKEFDTGVPKTVAFTMKFPAGVDSQVTAVSGEWFVTVAVTSKSGDRAASEAAATSAVQTLLAAL